MGLIVSKEGQFEQLGIKEEVECILQDVRELKHLMAYRDYRMVDGRKFDIADAIACGIELGPKDAEYLRMPRGSEGVSELAKTLMKGDVRALSLNLKNIRPRVVFYSNKKHDIQGVYEDVFGNSIKSDFGTDWIGAQDYINAVDLLWSEIWFKDYPESLFEEMRTVVQFMQRTMEIERLANILEKTLLDHCEVWRNEVANENPEIDVSWIDYMTETHLKGLYMKIGHYMMWGMVGSSN